MSRKSIEFDAKVKNFKFFKETFFRGSNKIESKWKKIAFTHHIESIKSELINNQERKFHFHFTLEMKPDLGEINFDGEFILESPEQNKISFFLQNAPQALSQFYTPFILKNSYNNSEKIGKKEGLPFPPAKDILRRFGIK